MGKVKLLRGAHFYFPAVKLQGLHFKLKTPENFFVSNEINDLLGYAPPKINDLRTFPEFSDFKRDWKVKLLS